MDRDSAIDDARLAIRLGFFDEARELLSPLPDRDPARLNLLGVILQAQGFPRAARRHFGKAFRADRTYAPAAQNLRRRFELAAFGCTALPVALGDERPHLATLLRQLDALRRTNG